MAAILENVLTERMQFDDLKSWLISDSVENSSEKADFIPYFLNFVKENCAWLLSKNGKCVDRKTVRNDNKNLVQVSGSQSQANQDGFGSNKPVFPKKGFDGDKNRNKTGYIRGHGDKRQFQVSEHSNRTGAVDYSKGVSPYKWVDEYRNGGDSEYFAYQDSNFCQERSTTRIKSTNGCMSYDETKRNNELKFNKFESSARKSLNFNPSRNIKSPGNNVDYKSNVPDINSFEAFPPVGSRNTGNTHDSKTRRRITPTPIQTVHKGSSKFSNSRFVAPETVSNEVFERTPVIETTGSDLQQEREMLKMTRKFLSATNSLNNSRVESIASPVKSMTVQYVVPDPDKICHRNELEMFSLIYDLLICNALVPNVTSELYFIFELITSKVLPEDKSEIENNIFCSVHNCVFFASSVLCRLKKFLNLLDNNTLSSLSEIPYLPKFSSELIKFLQACCNEIEEVSIKSQPLNRVPFILEEDNVKNFINSYAFTNFRKQRDLFYELLRDWQQQPLDSIDSKFRDSFSRKVKNLINLGPNAINMHHLAKLFQNQLIASCLGLEVSEVYDELLSSIQKNFPGKIEKLHQRFMMPFCVGGPNPPPTFYGTQAFFSELIQAASSASFNQHLLDIFVCKILELDKSDIFSDELDSLGTVKEKYIFLLHTLRLLGKFLGYLYFLPYKVSESLPSNILIHQRMARKHSVPPLDIPKLLMSAIQNKQVILTVPWIVEFLSMADSVGKSLPYVEETLEILTSLYRGKYLIPTESLNFLFLHLIIGWLFDVFCYPSKYNNFLQPIAFQKDMELKGIDFLDIIDKHLIYSCCPYLVEFKVLIYSFINGIRNENKREVRKITPLSTNKPSISASSAKQQMQTQMEENFFFIQPPSLKKTVEFVSERIASKIIQKIRVEVTNFKFQSVECITNEEAYKKLIDANIVKKNSYLNSCILELYRKTQNIITNYIQVVCPNDIKSALSSLLSDDLKPPVLSICCKIADRLAVDKIVDWCDTNLIFEDIRNDIINKLNHLSKSDTDSNTEDEISLSSILTSLRKLIVANFSGSSDKIADYIPILKEVLTLLAKPMKTSSRNLILYLTVDLYISILTNYPEKCDKEGIETFLSIWTSCHSTFDLENYLLGPQNIKFIINGKNVNESYAKLALILTDLLNIGRFSLTKLKKCLNSLNSCKWEHGKDEPVLQFLSNFLLKFEKKDDI